jgi:hypothetical protein
MGHLDRAKLVTSALQQLTSFTYGTYKAVQAWKGLDSNPVKQAAMAEVQHQAAGSLQTVVRQRAITIDPSIASASPALRQRAQSATISKMGSSATRPRSLSEAVLSSDKPVPLPKAKEGWMGIKPRKLNATEITLCAIAVAISCVVLVLSCISAAQSWKNLDDAEKWLTVLSLIVQMIQIIFDVILIFCSMSSFFAIGIAIVGLVIWLFMDKHEKKKAKEASEGPVEKWFRTQGRPWLNKQPLPPPTHFEWSIITERKADIGKETEI